MDRMIKYSFRSVYDTNYGKVKEARTVIYNYHLKYCVMMNFN